MLSLLLATVGIPELAAQTASRSPADPSFLFVQTAARGQFTALEEGRYRLTLEDVSPGTVYFSDRPERVAGATATSVFLDVFPFRDDKPPNAAVVLAEPASEEQDVVIVELLRPSFDPDRRTLTYEAVLLGDYEKRGLKFWRQRGDARLPKSFSGVSLFIDDCPDETVVCYGAYQCTDNQCCRVSCGALEGKHGYCWDWLALACKPCRDYSHDCTETMCNDTSAFCKRDMCDTSPDCASNG